MQDEEIKKTSSHERMQFAQLNYQLIDISAEWLRRAQRKVKNNTILYSTVRPRLKHYGILNFPSSNLIVSTGFVTIDLKEQYKDEIDDRYLYLILTQPTITEYIGNIADTAVSAYPSINPSDIVSLIFEFPDISIQKQIANIWSNLDKKVALNRAINYDLSHIKKRDRKPFYIMLSISSMSLQSIL